MTRREVAVAGGIPITTWVSIGVLFIAILGGASKFYASDEVQTSKIGSIEARVAKIESNNEQVMKLLYEISERTARIEEKVQ